MSDLFRLSEAQVDRLRPLFPKSRGKPRVNDRRVLSGIIFTQRNGLMWKHAPAAYGPPKTLDNRWKRLSRMAELVAGFLSVWLRRLHRTIGTPLQLPDRREMVG